MDFVDNFIPVPDHEYQGGVSSLGSSMISDRNFANLRRPYIDKNGNPAVTLNMGHTTLVKGKQVPIKEHVLVRDVINKYGINSPVLNATSIRKEEWLLMDRQVERAARFRLRAWTDLAASNSFGGFDGMSKMILEHETMTDPGEAMVDMDGITDGRTDSPKFQLEGLPLPITHSDFWFSERRLKISRGSTPLDTVLAEAAARRVAETVEKTTIGVTTGVTYGGNSTQVGGYGRTPTVYGYTNFSNRLTKTNLTTPTTTNQATTLSEVLGMRDTLTANKFFGPFMIYHSNDWDKFMDGDYILSGGNVATQTLRERLKAIDGIQDVKRLDMLFGSQLSSATGPGTDVDVTLKPFTLIMVQMTPDVARAVIGMNITTLQWDSVGGMRKNFKVMCILVPQLRADAYGNCGILHATTS